MEINFFVFCIMPDYFLKEEVTLPKKMNAMSFQNYALLLKDIIL